MRLQYHQTYALMTSGGAVGDSEDTAIDVVDVEKWMGTNVT